jgi:hypothetical protein
MGVQKRSMQKIILNITAILIVATAAMISCIGASCVVWQYEGDPSSSSEQISPSHFSDAQTSNNSSSDASNGLFNLDRSATSSSSSSSSSSSGSLWNWGGAPRGFSVSNGTIKYPDDYYTSHFNLGYGDRGIAYGQTKLQNLSRYATGFSTGYYAGNSIYSLLADSNSTYDPWNNYHGYDPNYPYGYPSS